MEVRATTKARGNSPTPQRAIPPDDDLRRRVLNFLASRNPGTIPRVVVQGDIVILSGNAACQCERRRIELCCRRVAGVRNVINRISIATAVKTARRRRVPR